MSRAVSIVSKLLLTSSGELNAPTTECLDLSIVIVLTKRPRELDPTPLL